MLMPLWMKIYCLCFIVIIISNITLNYKFKVKHLITVYEVISAGYLLYIIYAYWTPSVLARLNVLHVTALTLLILTDIAFTVWGDFSMFAKELPPIQKKEQEVAKAVSIIVASPAYVTGILTALQIITRTYHHI